MKIIVDENIEFGGEAFSGFGEVELMHGRKIANESLKDCDALIVRSITKVDDNLLSDTPVKFVGTATIGTDHLDLNYLESRNIKYASAPGCNSFAVTEYVLTAISLFAHQSNFELADKSLGVVGYGNIGKKITRFTKSIGMKVLVNDPPLERDGYDYNFSSFEEILGCDIITLHVPMNKSGIDKTLHLFDEEKINLLKPGTVLINSSRGGVVDNFALLDRLGKYNDITAVLDVWENEPKVNGDLLQRVYFGTPHIAGYSLEGKVNGTKMIYDALCKFVNATPIWQPELPRVNDSFLTVKDNLSDTELLHSITNRIYSIDEDSNSLKKLAELNEQQRAENFDLLRKTYQLRREFNNYKISEKNLIERQKIILQELRFKIT